MRSHDFGTFMSFPGCKTGKHTQEKPAPLFKSSPAPASAPVRKRLHAAGKQPRRKELQRQSGLILRA